MKKIILAALSIFPAVAFAGGSMGGGGLGIAEDLALSLVDDAGLSTRIEIPDLGLDRVSVTPDIYRRTRLRLSALDQTTIKTPEGAEISVKSLNGGIVDLSESAQLVVTPAK